MDEGKTVTVEDSELITGTRYGLRVGCLDGTLAVTGSVLTDVVEIAGNKIASATFTGCTFKKRNQPQPKASVRCSTTFNNCNFENEFLYDSEEKEITVTFNNCTYNGKSLTADTIKTKIFSNSWSSLATKNKDVTVILNGTEVPLNFQ